MIALQVVRTSFGFHLRECMGSCLPPPPHPGPESVKSPESGLLPHSLKNKRKIFLYSMLLPSFVRKKTKKTKTKQKQNKNNQTRVTDCRLGARRSRFVSQVETVAVTCGGSFKNVSV